MYAIFYILVSVSETQEPFEAQFSIAQGAHIPYFAEFLIRRLEYAHGFAITGSQEWFVIELSM